MWVWKEFMSLLLAGYTSRCIDCFAKRSVAPQVQPQRSTRDICRDYDGLHDATVPSRIKKLFVPFVHAHGSWHLENGFQGDVQIRIDWRGLAMSPSCIVTEVRI
jgi:hypothetical protein